jgi:hypothetical protein
MPFFIFSKKISKTHFNLQKVEYLLVKNIEKQLSYQINKKEIRWFLFSLSISPIYLTNGFIWSTLIFLLYPPTNTCIYMNTIKMKDRLYKCTVSVSYVNDNLCPSIFLYRFRTIIICIHILYVCLSSFIISIYLTHYTKYLMYLYEESIKRI